MSTYLINNKHIKVILYIGLYFIVCEADDLYILKLYVSGLVYLVQNLTN